MPVDRRRFLAACSSVGLGSTLFPGVLLAALAADEKITPEMIDSAAAIAGVPVAPDQRAALLNTLTQNRKSYETLSALKMPNSVPPAFLFDPLPPGQRPTPPPAGVDGRKALRLSPAPATAGREVPADLNILAFATVRELGELVRRKKISAVNLTEMYIARLKRFDPQLKFVITTTEERALSQAREADKEIAAGKYRGPLHGIPWGAKDLLAVKGYPTTWGAGGFETQTLDEDATVVTRLDKAGAILIAKLTLGALAMGDHWFGGQTRNPWDTRQGSSGSSAGPGSATSAGCVAFSIGSETNGSISGPSTRCGVTGLRPTFGFVPRTGAMTLSWTMDKLGPICRSVEDCALVMQAIWGPDGQDQACQNAGCLAGRYEDGGPDGQDQACQNAFFQWDAAFNWKKLRVGYLRDDFEKPWVQNTPAPAPGATEDELGAYQRRKGAESATLASREYDRKYDLAALEVFRKKMGVELIPVAIPDAPYEAMRSIYSVEGAAAFQELTLSGRDKLLAERSASNWPNIFRAASFTPAVEYIQSMRARYLAIGHFAMLFEQVDVIVAPTTGPSQQGNVTNLTGHPAVIVPNGVRGPDAPQAISPGGAGLPAAASMASANNQSGGPGTPVSLTFLGGLYKDAETCAFAHAYQQAAGFLGLHPKLDA